MAAGNSLNPVVIPSYGTPIEIDSKTSSAWYRFWAALGNAISAGYSGNVTIPKLTTGGTQGSLTFTNGILTSVTQAT